MYLLLDIGATNLRIALSEDLKTLKQVQIEKTPTSWIMALYLIKKTVETWGSPQITGCCFGYSLALNNPPFEDDWTDRPIDLILSDTFHCPVDLQNDAALAGLGEASFGAGQKYAVVAYLTVSTGVGGARIFNQQLEQSAWGFEPGHQILSLDGEWNDLESYISGRGLTNRYHQDPASITDPQIWAEVEKYLAVGITNTILYWSPQIVILNGPIIKRLSLDSVTEHVRQMLKVFPILPEIKLAQLGDEAGLYGAMKYLQTTDA